jgi:hypothetical protein
MSLNAFNGVKLSADGTTVFVDGFSDPEFEVVTVDVAIISAEHATKRLQRSLDTPVLDGWQTEFAQADLDDGTPPFHDGELVHLVGAATSQAHGMFLWSDHGELPFTIEQEHTS